MNFIACIVKSAGSKVSANDLMRALIILDKSHGKIQEAILSPPLTAAWVEPFKWGQNMTLICLLSQWNASRTAEKITWVI